MNNQSPGDHTSNNEAAEFSPDGKLLAIAFFGRNMEIVYKKGALKKE